MFRGVGFTSILLRACQKRSGGQVANLPRPGIVTQSTSLSKVLARQAPFGTGPRRGNGCGTGNSRGGNFALDDEVYAFGSFQLEPARRLLLDDGKPIQLG